MGFGLLEKEQVIERWDALIGGAQGMGESVMAGAERSIEDSKAPDVKIEHRQMSPGVMSGIFGGKRPFIVVSNIVNPNLKPFKMYINTRDYGVNLQISWYLVHQPSIGMKLYQMLLSIPVIGHFFALVVFPFYALGKFIKSKEAGTLDLNIFDEQDLRAYVTNAHQCLHEAVDSMMKPEKFDTSKLNKHSQGFLGIV